MSAFCHPTPKLVSLKPVHKRSGTAKPASDSDRQWSAIPSLA